MALTPKLKLPIPELTETADGPDAFSDMALAIEAYLANRVLPGGPGSVTSTPVHHWGSLGAGAPSFANGAKVGDTYFNTALTATMRCIADDTWVQADGPHYVSSISNRPAVSAYGLYSGFQLYVASQNMVYVWDGTNWRNGAAGRFTPSGATTGDVITGVQGMVSATTNASGVLTINIGNTFSDVPEFVIMCPGSQGVSSNIRYITPNQAAHTVSVLNGTVFGGSGATIGTVATRVNYYAIGYND